MDEIFENKNTADENGEPIAEASAEPVNTEVRPENTESPDIAHENEFQPGQPEISGAPYTGGNTEDFTPPNIINYTPVNPIGDYKPVSRGLKYFAAVLAGVVLLTAASAGGYFLGRSSVRSSGDGNAKIELAAKSAKTDEKPPPRFTKRLNSRLWE